MPSRQKPEHVLMRTRRVDKKIAALGVRATARVKSKVAKAKLAARRSVKRIQEEAIDNERTGHPQKNHQKRKALQGRRSLEQSPMSDAKWARFLELTGNGISRVDTLKTLKLTKQTFEVYMITSVAAAKQLREAEAIWIRRSWNLDEIEQILSLISVGKTVKAACQKFGYDDARVGSFYRLVRKDARIKEMYDVARELQAEAWLDDNVDIADNRGNDTFVDEKGVRKTDHGVIQRDRLRVDTRQWGMGALNRKRFGDRKHVDISGEIQINHAVQLSRARRRLEKSKQPVTIEHETQEVST